MKPVKGRTERTKTFYSTRFCYILYGTCNELDFYAHINIILINKMGNYITIKNSAFSIKGVVGAMRVFAVTDNPVGLKIDSDSICV